MERGGSGVMEGVDIVRVVKGGIGGSRRTTRAAFRGQERYNKAQRAEKIEGKTKL